MAHDCPECGMSCYCNGDIDDINFGERWDCKCALTNQNCCGYEDYEEEDDWLDDEFDDIITDI